MHPVKIQSDKNQANVKQSQNSGVSTSRSLDNLETVTQKNYQQMADGSSQVSQLAAYQQMADNHLASQPAPVNNTGLPDNLKTGIENLSGYAMDDVNVHYNSPKPAQLQAHAYTQGTDIHVAPGQEKHLPHEAWHVVQQKQGRVQPTLQMKSGVQVNDDTGLEQEADVMGRKVLQMHADSTTSPSKSLHYASSDKAVVQMVRSRIQGLSESINLQELEDAIVPIDHEIELLSTTDQEEVINGFIKLERLNKWRQDYQTRIEALRNLNPGDTEYTHEQIKDQGTNVLKKFRLVLVSLANLRYTLNKSRKDYNDWQNQRAALSNYEESQRQASKVKEKKEKEKKTVEKTPTKHGPVGLGSKWGIYNKDLKWSGQLQFHQYVPEGSATIVKSLTSQELTDAVYNEAKAFWLSDPKKYTLSSAVGKVRMLYTFTEEGARSLMENYLICGSGDFADDNEEKWTGETAHPDYTIWKANEPGAYGIGRNRLAVLAQYCEKIEAFDSKGKKITLS